MLCVSGWTSPAQQEGCLAQTAVQTEEASCGGLFQDGTTLQPAQVRNKPCFHSQTEQSGHTVDECNIISLSPQNRHRAVNLFLQGYEKSWIEAEEHYFEDKLIEDLAVKPILISGFIMAWMIYSLVDDELLAEMSLLFKVVALCLAASCRNQMSRSLRKRRLWNTLIHFTSSSCSSAERLLLRSGMWLQFEPSLQLPTRFITCHRPGLHVSFLSF